MGCSPTPLPLSLDSTRRPFLLSSSSSPPPTTFSTPAARASVSLPSSRSPPFLKLLRRFCSSSTPKPVVPLLSPPLPGGTFLGLDDLCALQALRDFSVEVDLDPSGGGGGLLEIRPMGREELSATAELLAESFAESMLVPAGYVSFLAFLVRQYVEGRLALEPHVAVLVGYYREKGAEGEPQLAGTAEIAFDARGANDNAPTPTAPKDCPYICNMAVKMTLRRKRIGWHILKACEELIARMKAKRKVYLHCRVIDKIPYKMYKKAGYEIVKTESILAWLTLQRRKYLMCKELLPLNPDNTSSDVSTCDDHPI